MHHAAASGSGGAGVRPAGAAAGQGREERTFEDAQRELEDIVRRLEAGETSLDDAIALWQRGEELYRFCLSKLDAAQGEIEELAKRVHAAEPTSPA